MMTAQEIFDAVINHLVAQGKPATTEGGVCVYRSDTGLKCAVGCLIPSDNYRPEFDDIKQLKELAREHPERLIDQIMPTGTGVHMLSTYVPFVQALAAGGVDLQKHSLLLADLQKMHDFLETSSLTGMWYSAQRIAGDHNLSLDAVPATVKGSVPAAEAFSLPGQDDPV